MPVLFRQRVPSPRILPLYAFAISLIALAIAQGRSYSQTVPAICQAADSKSLQDCIQKIASNEAHYIEITGQIFCSGKNSCRFVVENINRPIVILGRPGTAAGFKRSDSYDYEIFTINNSSHVQIGNLIFDENADGACTTICAATIGIYNSSDIVVDGVTLLHAKRMGLALSNVRNVVVRNSTFTNAAWFGLWTDTFGGNVSQTVSIENNRFTDIGSNALYFANVASVEGGQSRIRNNIFTHNHRKAIFHVCGEAGNEPCGGGQLYIEKSMYLIIENNVIQNGMTDDASRAPVSGIELNPNIHYVTITNNNIHDHTGYGIYMNQGTTSPSNIAIVKNAFARNWGGDVNVPDALVAENCTLGVLPGRRCSLAVSGVMSAFPNPCVIRWTETTCTAVINWNSTGTTNVVIRVKGTGQVFAMGEAGSQLVSWITEIGATFELLAGDTVIAELQVNGIRPRAFDPPRLRPTATVPAVALTQTPGPSPSPSPSSDPRRGQVTPGPEKPTPLASPMVR